MSLTTWFPNLAKGNHRLTSPEDDKYNCIAWASGDDTVWWEPHSKYHWPIDRIPDDVEPVVQDIAALFLAEGFEAHDDEAHEPGYDRVAIYGTTRELFTHIARQLDSGWWASKLGPYEDIEHESLSVLEGLYYGQVAIILRKAKMWQGKSAPQQT